MPLCTLETKSELWRPASGHRSYCRSALNRPIASWLKFESDLLVSIFIALNSGVGSSATSASICNPHMIMIESKITIFILKAPGNTRAPVSRAPLSGAIKHAPPVCTIREFATGRTQAENQSKCRSLLNTPALIANVSTLPRQTYARISIVFI